MLLNGLTVLTHGLELKGTWGQSHFHTLKMVYFDHGNNITCGWPQFTLLWTRDDTTIASKTADHIACRRA